MLARETGWTGIFVQSEGGSIRTTTASHFGKSITAFQNEDVVRCVGTLDQPNALTGVCGEQSALLALAEGVQV